MSVSSVSSLTWLGASPTDSGATLRRGQDLSSSVDAFDTVAGLLDLTRSPRPLSSVLQPSGNAAAGKALTMYANLLQRGVIGTETYDVSGHPYTRFVETTIGDSRLDGLGPYRSRTTPRNILDAAA